MRMKVVYDLSCDEQRVASLQRASMSLGPVGLKMSNGLVGSNDWWENIRSGQIQVHILEGKIDKIWWGRPGDHPEFEVVDPNGNNSRWTYPTIDAKSRSEHELKLERQVEISFVDQELKTLFSGNTTTKLLLKLKIEAPWAEIS